MALWPFSRRRSQVATRPAAWFRGSTRRPGSAAAESGGPGLERHDRDGERRWPAAQDNRLNTGSWSGTIGDTLNADIDQYLDTLRTRSAKEVARNPILEGVITTYASDCIGPSGPTLQVQSDDETYNSALERVWQQWWAKPDLNGQLAGVDLLSSWIRSLWLNGEFLCQIVTDRTAEGTIKTRLLDIHPRRLATPMSKADGSVAMGVEINDQAKPLRYHVSKPTHFGALQVDTGQYDSLATADVIHGFRCLEAGQIRGVPWVAPVLQSAADLRDYDDQVLDCARQAANMGVAWYAEHPDANYFEVNETRTLQRGTEWTGPPGWKPFQIRPEQPHTQYVEYRRERLAELGRPASMPLMMIRLTAERHNYSSARMDAQIYARALRTIQAWLVRVALNRLVELIAREAELAGKIPARPETIRYDWAWPVLPHVDPAKEANGERIGMENGTVPFSDACAARGTDEDTVIAKWKRTNEKLIEAGLDPLPSPMAYLMATAQPAEPDPDPDDDEDEDDDDEDITPDKEKPNASR